MADKKETDYRNMEGIFCEKPTIIYEQGKYKIEDVKRLAIINREHTENNVYFLGELCHELLRSVNASLCSYTVEGDILTLKDGLCERTIKLSTDKDVVIQEEVGTIGYGLEKGIVDYTTLTIMRNDYYDNYDLHYHALSTLVAGTLMDMLKLRDCIQEAQVTKDTSRLSDMIEAHTGMSYRDFLQMIDSLHDLEVKRNKAIDSEERMQAADELESYYADVVAPTISRMRMSMNISVDHIAEQNKPSL